jgi:hypothetical protein
MDRVRRLVGRQQTEVHEAEDAMQQIESDIWMVDGPDVSFYGFPYPTRMVVVRRGGDLWIWSPIELSDELKAEVDALGSVRWLATPNSLHHLFISQWLEAYPEAEAYASPGLAKKRDDIDFVATLDDEPVAEWQPEIAHVVVRGSVMDEVLYFHRPSSTCLVGDLIQRHSEDSFSGWKATVMKLDGMVGEDGSTPREWRATFLNRGPAREALQTALDWEPEHVVIAHGECALENGSEMLRHNLGWITKPWPA